MKTCCNSWKTLLCMVCIAGLLMTGTPAWASECMVTMSVVDSNLRVVLTEVAQMGKANVVIDVDPKEIITVDFKNVPFETALNFIARTKGLNVDKRENNIFVVTSPEKMDKGFGQVEVFPLKYARADHIKNIIVGGGKSDSEFAVENPSDSGGSGGSSTITLKGTPTEATKSSKNDIGLKGLVINTDASNNAIIAFGAPGQIEKVRKLLKELDVPYKQILLEAQVINLSKSASKELGIDYTWSRFPALVDDAAFPVAIVKGGDGFGYQFGFSAKLSALIKDGDGKVMARPNVTTFNGNKATIFVGDQLPIVTETVSTGGLSTYTTEYKNAGITLSYVPRINDDNMISASVFVEVSTPTTVTLNIGGRRTDAYQIKTRSAQTNVRMKDGDTMVIGGLITNSDIKEFNKVPFLGDLPIIGKLFQSVSKSKDETEVVIFLKAKIVK